MALTKINTNLIAVNTIAASNIADNALDSTKIASNSILTRHIDDNQITTDQIAENTIATANIADNAVDSTKIAQNSILTRHIDDDQVTGDQLADNLTIAGTLASTGVLTANAGVVIDNITIDGTEIDLSSGDLTIDVAGDITLDADGADIIFADGGTTFLEIDKDGNNARIKNPISDGDIKIQGNDGGSIITAIDIDMSAGGNVGIGGAPATAAGISQYLTIYGGDSGIALKDSSANDTVELYNAGGKLYVYGGTGGSNGDRFQLDCVNTRLGIGTMSPDTNLEVESSAGAATIIRSKGTVADGYRAGFEASTTHTGGTVWSMFSTNNSDGYFGGGKFVIANETMGDVDANTAAKVVIDGSGNVGIGNITPSTNHSKANNLVVGGGSAGGMAVYNGTAEGWYAFSRDNANNTDAYDGGISYNGDRQLKFHANAGGTRMMLNSDGLHFGSDTATANALDDYEEGTFTPTYTVQGGGSAGTVTGTNVGTYTKVGRMVTVGVTSFYVPTSGTVPTSYSMALPFNASSTGGQGGGGFGQESGQTGHGMLVHVVNGAQTAVIWKYNGSAVPANAYLQFSFTYQAA